MHAVMSRHTEIVKELLKNRVNVDLRDKDGRTAWMHAKRTGNREIKELFDKYM